uniref:Uncharacterized protein n=1 Tax=Anguilla anguilla TaxID=7936 RepID=A0A0E9T803_ANGAN
MYLPYLFTHVHIAPSSSVPKYISLHQSLPQS